MYSREVDYVLTSAFEISFTATVAILTVLQGLISYFTADAVAQSFETIQWTLASRDGGLRLLSFLALSPTTGVIGALKLVFGKHEKLPDRFSAASRYE